MGAIELSYRLVGTGWSEASLTLGDREVRLTASYISDALGDLLEAVRRLSEVAEVVRVSWEEEPGEYRWLLQREGSGVDIRILTFGDFEDHEADDMGQEMIQGRVTLDALVRVVAAAARDVLETHGESGYKERWDQHPFRRSR